MMEQRLSAALQNPEVDPGASLHSSMDEVIAAYKKDVDRTLLRENLRLSVTERIDRFEGMARQFIEIYEAGRRSRGEV